MAHTKTYAEGAIKIRPPMITLHHIARLTGGLAVSTANLSELWMGFRSLNGDVDDFSPFQHVWKGLEAYTIAEELGVPEASLNAVPTDGLDVIPAGVDEDQLGLPYPELDRVIVRLLQNKLDSPGALPRPDEDALMEKIAKETGHPTEVVQHITRKLTGSHFKRRWPIEIT